MNRVLILLAVSWLTRAPVPAQKLDPVQWTLTLEPRTARPGSTVLARFEATLEDGWYLYSPTTPPGGPIPTRIDLEPAPGLSSYRLYQRRPAVKFDANFNLDTEVYSGKTEFLFELILAEDAAPGPLEVRARARYQTCTDKLCLPPVRKTAAATLMVDSVAPVVAPAIPADFLPVGEAVSLAAKTSAPPVSPPPVERAGRTQAGGIPFVGVAFGFGLAAVFTPCVFPMIPITVSFFLRQRGGGRRDSIIQALI